MLRNLIPDLKLAFRLLLKKPVFTLAALLNLAIGIGVYFLQVAFSAYWLQRYLYGPVEWLWRGAMYGRWQPFRRSRELVAINSKN